jgi:hypothetical protein
MNKDENKEDMTRKDKLITPLILPDKITPEKLKQAIQIYNLQRHIIYVDYATIALRQRYNENLAHEVRSLGYTLPAFEDENYIKALDTIVALDKDRIDELENLLNQYNS